MTKVLIPVIFIFLFIILTERIELRIISHGHLTIEISSVLFKLTLTDFGAKKRKGSHPSPSDLYSATKFILKHSAFTVSDVALSENMPLPMRGAAEAIISVLLAYCDGISGKINLPKKVSTTSLPFAFDICIRSRLYIFISAFMLLKIKGYFKQRAGAQNVG